MEAFLLNLLLFLHWLSWIHISIYDMCCEFGHFGKYQEPWYLNINYWFWFFILIFPSLTYFTARGRKFKLQIVIMLALVLLGYLMLNLAIDLKYDLRAKIVNADPEALREDHLWVIGDSLDRICMFMFGWLLSLIYLVSWFFVWIFLLRFKKDNRC
ncbi:hypothetical protein N9Z27_02445 [Alphaproteobacteria bacterium]|nr:hypothetical protein [Alphaproteobacteria bacterium]